MDSAAPGRRGAGAGPSSGGLASIDVYDGFETPALSPLWATWRLADGAVQMQGAVVRAGQGAARITLHPHDVFGAGKHGDNDTERDDSPKPRPLSQEDRSYEFSWSM